MKRIISFVLTIITVLCLNSCCEQPSNSYGSPKNTFVEDLTKALEESNKAISSTVSEMGRFKLYDVLPDSTKIYQSIGLYVVVSSTGDVAITRY
jgi:hypothetical protein